MVAVWAKLINGIGVPFIVSAVISKVGGVWLSVAMLAETLTLNPKP